MVEKVQFCIDSCAEKSWKIDSVSSLLKAFGDDGVGVGFCGADKLSISKSTSNA